MSFLGISEISQGQVRLVSSGDRPAASTNGMSRAGVELAAAVLACMPALSAAVRGVPPAAAGSCTPMR